MERGWGERGRGWVGVERVGGGGAADRQTGRQIDRLTDRHRQREGGERRREREEKQIDTERAVLRGVID